ncbi:hypothetical protein DDZ18_11635 [Marinicauda salina]|uniref:CPBP family intramembrane metalloprotease n=1 Tax=Marinicauda salina TaxID=2135793 RepID=A0A2U2BS67_9PROT|nr:hypothetical protein [Marinicauda salina]PWE16836.1 hypothetical protein DDZ18_11635 [Marinicauda salina]
MQPWRARAPGDGAPFTPKAGLWIVAAAAVGFLVSWLGAGVLELPRRGFVAWHLAATGGFLAVWVVRTGFGFGALLHRWRLGLVAAAAAAGFSAGHVLSQPGAPISAGAALAGDLAWLGGIYAVLDAMLLTVVPVSAVFAATAARAGLSGPGGEILGSGLALLASLAVTAAYHAGFPEFRGAAMLAPLVGNGVIALAYVASRSPASAILAHVALHGAAVLNAPPAGGPLPPHY